MKEEFDKLIYDFLSGSIAKEDLHKLNEWIYSDPENQPITDLRNESANIRVLRQER